MKVLSKVKRAVDCYVGDVILFNSEPCMVIFLGDLMKGYGVLALEGSKAGEVLDEFDMISKIDTDSRTQEVLIKRQEVLICKEGASCQF